MSAPAVKSSMPGVGTSPSSTGHSMLPMNMMAQKVVPGSESGAMKPLSGSGLSYVTLQPPSQPLSLVQDHRQSVYQTQSYVSNNSEKEPESDKLTQNGIEARKVDGEEAPVSAKESETNRNNNQSPENSTQDQQPQTEPEPELPVLSLEFPGLCTNAQNKGDDKKVPINNGSKESEITTVPHQSKQSTSTPVSTPASASSIAPTSTPSAAPASTTALISTAAPPSEPTSSPTSTSTSTTASASASSSTSTSASPPVSAPVSITVPAPAVTSAQSSAPVAAPTTGTTPETTPVSVPTSTTGSGSTSTGQSAPSAKPTPAPIPAPKPPLVTAPTVTTTPTSTRATITATPSTPATTTTSQSGETKTNVESSPKTKSSNQSSKSAAESPIPASLTTPTKSDSKVTSPQRTNKRKSRELKDLKGQAGGGEGGSKPKRNRIQTQPYQSPLPEIALIVKTLNKTPSSKNSDDKLIVFYKNEFLAVRNAEGSFYVCQAMQNIYKSSRRIRIRWLSQDKNNGEIYSPDFYDFTDFDCILTNLNLNKIDKNKFQLTKIELLRTENILKRAIDVEAGVSEKPRVTEEHPDGLDLSLYKDESQLKRRKGSGKQKQRQRKRSKRSSSTSEDEVSEEELDKKVAAKSNRSKKRTPANKVLAIAKSVAKGPNRAERALNRGSKNNSGTGTATGIVTTTTATSTSTATTTTADTSKKNADTKKVEAKKPNKQQSNNASGTVQRTKLRGPSTANTQEGSSSTAGRPKRVAATTGIASSEDTSPRKKPRGRA